MLLGINFLVKSQDMDQETSKLAHILQGQGESWSASQVHSPANIEENVPGYNEGIVCAGVWKIFHIGRNIQKLWHFLIRY